MRLDRLGLLLDMIATVIVAFQPMQTLWGTGIRAKFPLLNGMGWLLLLAGFLCQFLETMKKPLTEKPGLP